MKEIPVGEAVKRRREELGLTQEQVCLGICDSCTMSRLENHRADAQPPDVGGHSPAAGHAGGPLLCPSQRQGGRAGADGKRDRPQRRAL